MRPAGGAHPVVCVGPNAPNVVTGTLCCKKHLPSDEMLNRSPDSLCSLKIPGCPTKKSRGCNPGILAKFAYWPLAIMAS